MASDQQLVCSQEPWRPYPATEALAKEDEAWLGSRRSSTFVDFSSLLVDLKEPRSVAEDFDFPLIEWSYYEYGGSAATMLATSDDNNAHTIMKRRERLRDLLSQRSRRRSAGLVRCKSLQCLPSAAASEEEFVSVSSSHSKDRRISAPPTTTISTTAPTLKKILEMQQQRTASPVSPAEIGCLKREEALNYVSWLGQKYGRNTSPPSLKQQKQQQRRLCVTPPSPTPLASDQASEAKLLSSILMDCPFPTCP